MQVDVAEAARILGISHDAVRARIRRGTLEAVKEGGTWRVMVPDDTDTTETGHATTADSSPDALIDQLQGEVAYLRSELTAARQQAAAERERADVLQREALDRLQSMIPLALGPPGSPESHETGTTHTGTPLTDTTTTGTRHDATEGRERHKTPGLIGWLRQLFRP